ncbi:hypothetical protein ACEQ8H_004592 [Pleosporales sp. CAS-2024a]
MARVRERTVVAPTPTTTTPTPTPKKPRSAEQPFPAKSASSLNSSSQGPCVSSTDDDDATTPAPQPTASSSNSSLELPAAVASMSLFRRPSTRAELHYAHVTVSPDTALDLQDDEWDYSETEWWGWVILAATWIVFVVVMGSCFGVWSWAWDVGETPYAPPDLEDDDTLPITGYYPALMICTAVMSWVWVVVAWVGMKYLVMPPSLAKLTDIVPCQCLHCEKTIMTLRRNPQRGCQEMSLPLPLRLPLPTTCRLQPTVTQVKHATTHKKEPPLLTPRRRKRHTTDSERLKQRISVLHTQPTPPGRPFPFFRLPRELRDQVYSSLVTRSDGHYPIISAISLLNDKKARRATHIKRERLNRKRIVDGKPPIRIRDSRPEPIVHLNLLRASRRLGDEAREWFYNSNWFAVTLDKLPLTTFEAPYGWDISKITRLQVEIQMKDAAHMNNYVDWTSFLCAFTSVRFLHIIPTFHPRYSAWACPELSSWASFHYVHKAFFRELLAAIPSNVDTRFMGSMSATKDMQLQGQPMSDTAIEDLYAELTVARVVVVKATKA